MSGSDREIRNWDQRLKDQVRLGWDNYLRRRIHLDAARSLEEWGIAGEYLYVEEVSSESARLTISLNRNTNDPIDLENGVKIRTIFTQIYITNTAQPGEWIDLIIGINFEYTKPAGRGLDAGVAQQVLNLTHANADTSAAAAAHPCNSALIKADVNNTQVAWIDFGVAAVQSDCLPLDAGEWVRVKISNTDQINANFEVGGELVFIVYEV